MEPQLIDIARIAGKLKEEISRGLPGTDVQWQMASSDRMAKDFPRVPGKDATIAAVLILLYPYMDSVCTVFMQRPEYNGIHSGQISFPGGRMEISDKDIVRTALREANEEIGTDPSEISVLDTLTPLFIPVSNMLVTPVVAWSPERPQFTRQPEEVVFLIEADIQKFLSGSIVKTRPLEVRGQTMEVRYFDYDGHVIWGATAMMLNELLEIIRRGKIL
jgi:8-oxo-dGTP pyrophosphatase MutT (NUDIX family)